MCRGGGGWGGEGSESERSATSVRAGGGEGGKRSPPSGAPPPTSPRERRSPPERERRARARATGGARRADALCHGAAVALARQAARAVRARRVVVTLGALALLAGERLGARRAREPKVGDAELAVARDETVAGLPRGETARRERASERQDTGGGGRGGSAERASARESVGARERVSHLEVAVEHADIMESGDAEQQLGVSARGRTLVREGGPIPREGGGERGGRGNTFSRSPGT